MSGEGRFPGTPITKGDIRVGSLVDFKGHTSLYVYSPFPFVVVFLAFGKQLVASSILNIVTSINFKRSIPYSNSLTSQLLSLAYHDPLRYPPIVHGVTGAVSPPKSSPT